MKKGRIAYIAVENPDDLRMRIMVAALHSNVDLGKIGDDLLILDRRMKPEELVSALIAAAPFSLVMIDTFAAFFDGTDVNDPVETGNFMRRLRPMTQIGGRPSVIVAAHPKKNATGDDLIPYGAGAILNEVDGNLTLRRTLGGLRELHWQGKLRGIEFEPVRFCVDLLTSPEVKDVEGREVRLPVLKPAPEQNVKRREGCAQAKKTAQNKNIATLRAMSADPHGTLDTWSTATGIHKASIKRCVDRLAIPAGGKLVKNTNGKWSLTAAGRKALG